MISVVGLSPEQAREKLSAEGYAVVLEEARSRKGVEGGTQARVIRQGVANNGQIVLTYAIFRTEPTESKS